MKIFISNSAQTQSVYRYNTTSHLKSPFGKNIHSICFRGQDFLDLSEEEILKRIKDSIKPENFIGQGTEAEVYRIKDTDYCVRIPYLANNIFWSNFTKELTPTDKINHIVAKLGFGTSVMKYFSGHTPKEHKDNKLYRNQFQEKIADMPVKAYTELLYQIADGINNDMLYDFSGGNLIVNVKDNKLTAIDFCKINESTRKIRPLTEMYSVLTCYGSEKETGKKIFDKIVLAGLEEFKPCYIPCMDLELFDFIDLAIKRNNDNNSYKQELCFNNKSKFNKFMDSLRESFIILKKIKKSEITDKTYSDALEQSIKNFLKLIKKIH